MWDKTFAMLCIMNHTCVQCLGAALTVTAHREHLKQSYTEQPQLFYFRSLLNCNTQVLGKKPNASPCLYVQLGAVIAAAY